MATEAQIEAWTRANTRDFNQECQAFAYQLCLKFGTAPNPVYTSARAAKLASTIVSSDMNAAPFGAWGYWHLGTLDHVMFSLGGGKWLGGSSHLDTKWGVNTGTVTSADWMRMSGGTLPAGYGWAHSNGHNTLPVQVPVTSLLPTQRQVKATGVVNRRTGPGTKYPETGVDLPVNTVGNMIAFAHGPVSKGQPAGNDVWYQGTSKDWFWAGGFTVVSGDHLVDETAQFADPVVVVPPPVVVVPVPPVVVPDPPVVVADPPVVTAPVVIVPDPPVVIPTPPVTTPKPPIKTKPPTSPHAVAAWITALIAIAGVIAEWFAKAGH